MGTRITIRILRCLGITRIKSEGPLQSAGRWPSTTTTPQNTDWLTKISRPLLQKADLLKLFTLLRSPVKAGTNECGGQLTVAALVLHQQVHIWCGMRVRVGNVFSRFSLFLRCDGKCVCVSAQSVFIYH